jgi:hypothetical protein
MYGENYGYRSGLNPSMVRHLHGKLARILGIIDLSGSPIVLDIGSNDGTTLAGYPESSCTRIGMDPTAAKFRDYYPEDVTVVADFFSAKRFQATFPGKRARIVTSFSMFYDLERPIDFMREISAHPEDDGVWDSSKVTCRSCSSATHDTVCHEHPEYYAPQAIKWMTDRVDFKIVDEVNEINGGSFSGRRQEERPLPVCRVESVLRREIDRLIPDTAERLRRSSTAGRKSRGFVEEGAGRLARRARGFN